MEENVHSKAPLSFSLFRVKVFEGVLCDMEKKLNSSASHWIFIVKDSWA